MKVFDNIRSLLLDPQNAQARQELLNAASAAKLLAAISGVAFGTLTILSLIFAVSHPILGVIGLTGFGFLTLLSRDIFVISGNTEKNFDDNGFFGNISTCLKNALNSKAFVNNLYKGTLIAGPCFNSLTIRTYERKTNYLLPH